MHRPAEVSQNPSASPSTSCASISLNPCHERFDLVLPALTPRVESHERYRAIKGLFGGVPVEMRCSGCWILLEEEGPQPGRGHRARETEEKEGDAL